MEKLVETIQNNQYMLYSAYVILGLLAINFLLIIISLITKKKPFGIHKDSRNFLGKVFGELKLVEWLSAKETARYTFIVLIVATVFGGIIALLDLGFFKLRDLLI